MSGAGGSTPDRCSQTESSSASPGVGDQEQGIVHPSLSHPHHHQHPTGASTLVGRHHHTTDTPSPAYRVRHPSDVMATAYANNTHILHKDKLVDKAIFGDEIDQEKAKSSVPLRQRQLPASFWQEPNKNGRPPHRLHGGMDDPAAALLAQYPYPIKHVDYKTLLDASYGSANAYALGHDSSSRGGGGVHGGAADYLYSNYAAKYQHEPQTPYGLTWNYNLIPSDEKQNHHSALLNSPHAHSLYLRHSLGASGYPSTTGWDHVNIPAPPSARASNVWRPIPTKTLSSFPTRYHPFGDVH